jgi:hypothetical protein
MGVLFMVGNPKEVFRLVSFRQLQNPLVGDD